MLSAVTVSRYLPAQGGKIFLRLAADSMAKGGEQAATETRAALFGPRGPTVERETVRIAEAVPVTFAANVAGRPLVLAEQVIIVIMIALIGIASWICALR
jgi:hypothetical protein